MSQWARNNPELMEEISRLPAHEQMPAIRHAVGWSRERDDDLGALPNRCPSCRERFSGPVCDNCGKPT